MGKDQSEKYLNPKLVLRHIMSTLPVVDDKEWDDIIRNTILGLYAHSETFITVEDINAGRVEFLAELSYSQLGEVCGKKRETVKWRVKQLRDRFNLLYWHKSKYGVVAHVKYSGEPVAMPEHSSSNAEASENRETANTDYPSSENDEADNHETANLHYLSKPKHRLGSNLSGGSVSETGNQNPRQVMEHSEAGNGESETGNGTPETGNPGLPTLSSVFELSQKPTGLSGFSAGKRESNFAGKDIPPTAEKPTTQKPPKPAQPDHREETRRALDNLSAARRMVKNKSSAAAPAKKSVPIPCDKHGVNYRRFGVRLDCDLATDEDELVVVKDIDVSDL